MSKLANVEASRRQKLFNCAAWNEEQARKAAKVGDAQRAERLARQAERLREQAEQGQC